MLTLCPSSNGQCHNYVYDNDKLTHDGDILRQPEKEFYASSGEPKNALSADFETVAKPHKWSGEWIDQPKEKPQPKGKPQSKG